jgi:L-threonylcarbamoyladenylate synthase
VAPGLIRQLIVMAAPLSRYLHRGGIERIAALLAAGGVVILPTDTIYGFHCAVSRMAAVHRIRALKGRGTGSGFILLAADCAMVDTLVGRWPGSSKELLSSLWPAPLTAVLPARRNMPSLIAPRGTIAVRVPASRELRSIIAAVGEPLVSTSVNASGAAPMTSIAGIRKSFPGLDAYVSQRGRSSRLPSTLVDFTVHPPRVVRAGAYPFR